MNDDQVALEPNQEEIMVAGNGTVAAIPGDQTKVPLDDILRNVYDMKHEYLPQKKGPMSELFDEWVGQHVRLPDDRTGKVIGVDPRPRHAIDDRATKPGNYLYIRLDYPGDGRPVVFEQAENVQRVD